MARRLSKESKGTLKFCASIKLFSFHWSFSLRLTPTLSLVCLSVFLFVYLPLFFPDFYPFPPISSFSLSVCFVSIIIVSLYAFCYLFLKVIGDKQGGNTALALAQLGNLNVLEEIQALFLYFLLSPTMRKKTRSSLISKLNPTSKWQPPTSTSGNVTELQCLIFQDTKQC